MDRVDVLIDAGEQRAAVEGQGRAVVHGIIVDQVVIAEAQAAKGGTAVRGEDHAVRQAGRDTGGGVCVGRSVAARAADERVRTGAAFQHVVPGAAVERVGVAVAGQGIVEARAGQVLDAGQRISLRVAAAAGAGRKIDGHARARAAVRSGVGARTTVQAIRTAAADQHVIAGAAVDDIGTAPAAGRELGHVVPQVGDRVVPVPEREVLALQLLEHQPARPRQQAYALVDGQLVGVRHVAEDHIVAGPTVDHVGADIAEGAEQRLLQRARVTEIDDLGTVGVIDLIQGR